MAWEAGGSERRSENTIVEGEVFGLVAEDAHDSSVPPKVPLPFLFADNSDPDRDYLDLVA